MISLTRARVLAVLLPLILLGLGACAPEPHLVFHDGSSAAVHEYRSRWLVINFWATWCSPCIAEIPELNRLAGQLGEGAAVLGVNADSLRGGELSAAMQELGVAFPVVQDGAQHLVPQLMQEVLPTTWVLAPDGSAPRVLHGEQSAEGLLRTLEQMGYAGEVL